jgi:hypothetical protein
MHQMTTAVMIRLDRRNDGRLVGFKSRSLFLVDDAYRIIEEFLGHGAGHGLKTLIQSRLKGLFGVFPCRLGIQVGLEIGRGVLLPFFEGFHHPLVPFSIFGGF